MFVVLVTLRTSNFCKIIMVLSFKLFIITFCFEELSGIVEKVSTAT